MAIQNKKPVSLAGVSKDESDSDSDYVEEMDGEKSDTDYNWLCENSELNGNKSLKEKYITRDINLSGIFVREN